MNRRVKQVNRRVKQGVAGVVLMLAASAAVAEVPLGTVVFEGTGQTTAQPSWQPFLSYGNPSDVSPAGFMNNVTMGFIDVVNGTRTDLSGDFAGFESFAVDNADQPIYVGFTVPGGSGDQSLTTELALFGSAVSPAPGVGAPDFAGYDLTRINVMTTAFSSGTGGQFTITTEFTIYGERIPEPTSLASLAAFTLLARRRRG